MKTALEGPRHPTTPKATRLGNRKSQRANSLLEVVMATAILAVMGAGIVGSINYGMFMMRLARENARATQIMLEKLESIRLYDWDQVNTPGFVPTDFIDVYDPQGATNQQGAVYTGQLTVLPCTNSTSYSTNMRQFVVTLSWTTSGLINHSRSMSTFVARDGIQNYVY
jgi:type II secretory pathway pseudopilin PulG